DPGNLLALEHLGYCRYHMNQPREAEKAYRRLLELDPKRASAHVSLGAALEKLGERKTARAHFQQAQELDPTYPKAYLRMGYAMLEGGDGEGARGQFQKAVELEPESVEARKGLARAYRLMGNLIEATAAYEELTVESADAEVLAELAEIRLLQGKPENAREALQQALDLDPRQWKALYVRSMILTQSGDEVAARKDLERVVQLRPHFTRAHHDLGVIYARQDDEARAIAAYQRALELEPNALSHNGLGTVYARAGKWRAAVEQFGKAIKLDVNYRTAYQNLAQAYEAMGRPEQADAVLKRLEEIRDRTSR
ncbi:MAG: tetratricopeptide repeat protein, partial [Acidobacteriota bacterium]